MVQVMFLLFRTAFHLYSKLQSKLLYIVQLYSIPEITNITVKYNLVNIKCSTFVCKYKIGVSNICLVNVSVLKTFKHHGFISTYKYYYRYIIVQIRKTAQNHYIFGRLGPLITQVRIYSGR